MDKVPYNAAEAKAFADAEERANGGPSRLSNTMRQYAALASDDWSDELCVCCERPAAEWHEGIPWCADDDCHKVAEARMRLDRAHPTQETDR